MYYAYWLLVVFVEKNMFILIECDNFLGTKLLFFLQITALHIIN